MPPEFQRPEQGFRYEFKGLKLNQLPDALPQGKYAAALNIRAIQDSAIQSRPGQLLRFTSPSAATITDICTYATLNTDDIPRVLSRDVNDRIFLGSVQVGSLATSGAIKGASMLPFRPGASPNPYMYIANGVDYQKFSAPGALDAVIQANAGIAEPQTPPDSVILPVLSASSPTTETLQPTTFTTPDPTIGGAAATVPIAGPNPAFSATLTATLPSAFPNSFSSINWQGWSAASFPYTLSLTLNFDVDVTFTVVGAFFSNANIRLEYSFDAGVTWNTLANLNQSLPGDGTITLPRSIYGISIPLGTDLTQLWVRAWMNVGTTFATVTATMDVYNIYTTGTSGLGFFDRTGIAANWTPGGTAGAPSDVGGPGDNALAVIPDPLNPGIHSIGYQIIASPPASWQVGQTMIQAGNPYLLLDAMQPAISATIQSIYYFAGAAGRCIIVPQNLPSATVPAFVGGAPQAPNFLNPSAIAALRRGAILQLNATEYVYVLSVTIGPDNTICIETSTAGTYAPGQSISTLPTMIVYGTATPTTGGNNLTAPLITSAVTAGTGTLTRVENFFASVSSETGLQDADYLHASLLIDVPANLTQVTIAFDVGDGSFTQDFYYYTVRPSDLSGFLAGVVSQLASAQTVEQRAAIDALDPTTAGSLTTDSGDQLNPGVSQRTEILFPVGALTRVGTNNQTLINTTSVRITVLCTGNVNVTYGSLSTWGGSQPDVGEAGSPYFYRVRPRSKLTGVVGNPSPSTRYGQNPLRFSVLVHLPSAAYDAQIDTWDIFRYGGTVLSWRYIGSTPSSNTTFTDNFSDDAALAGNLLTFDEFQPWPSIDLPNNGIASSVIGTVAVVSSTNPNILAYLPGTLVQLAGQNVYTLQCRPTLISGSNYLLQFVENAGSLTNVPFNIQEPVIAQRRLPYMWGPDASGTVFACGDSLRPGTVSFSKNYAPDSAPDSYNLEICAPSEPLLGGEILDGLSFVASAERWWALYPTPDNPAQRFSIVQQPFLRGLAAPFGHCNDGVSIYWWAKDGIFSSTKGSLTSEDLYNLFPHEGVVGVDVTYGGVTVHAPDYSRCASFRLAFSNGYLYATYQDTTGTYHTLVLDTIDGSWSLDDYTPAVSCFFHPAQEAAALASVALTRYDELLMGNVIGQISTQAQGQNDLGAAIPCVVGVGEFNGGDDRAPKQWGDFFVDLLPSANAGVSFTPFSTNLAVTAGTLIPSSAFRTRQPVGVNGLAVSDFMGLLASWTDDYSTSQTKPTILYLWQPSFVIQPAFDINWQTFGSSFGLNGYMHVRELAMAYLSFAPVTLNITAYDGTSPPPIILPSTNGDYQKVLFPVGANKGQLFNFQATSTEEFQLFFDDCEIRVGQWGRNSPYQTFKNFGGQVRDSAPI